MFISVNIDDSMPSQLDMLKVLHLRTAEGEWIKGVPATVQAWSHTNWGWIFKPLLWPLMSTMLLDMHIIYGLKKDIAAYMTAIHVSVTISEYRCNWWKRWYRYGAR
jgi:hypothetical protein